MAITGYLLIVLGLSETWKGVLIGVGILIVLLGFLVATPETRNSRTRGEL